MKKNEKTANKEMSAYYKAVKLYKNQTLVLMFLVIVLVLSLIGLVFYGASTVYVSVPGDTFRVSRAFTNPYVTLDAESTVIDFCNYIHTFDESTYEINLQRGRSLATKEVYNAIYEAYYVIPQENGNPAYTNWITNNLNVQLIADSVSSHYNDEGIITVDYYGKQIYVKNYNSSLRQEIPVHYQATIAEMQTKIPENRMGIKIVSFQALQE